MAFWEKLLLRKLRRKMEGKVVREIVQWHWPAVERTIREEFGGEDVELALRAARRACERLLEHML